MHAHLAFFDTAVEHLVVQAFVHRGEALDRVALAGLDQVQVGIARQGLAFGLGLGNPLIELFVAQAMELERHAREADRKSTRLNSSHSQISYAVFCLKKKNKKKRRNNSV